MMLPLCRMNWGPLLIFCLLIHGVLNLMYFYVAPVLAMTYCSRLVGGLLLHVVLVLLEFAKCSKLSSLLDKFKVLVGGPNRKRLCGKTNMLPPNTAVAVASTLWTGLLFLYSTPGWLPSPWLQQ